MGWETCACVTLRAMPRIIRLAKQVDTTSCFIECLSLLNIIRTLWECNSFVLALEIGAMPLVSFTSFMR